MNKFREALHGYKYVIEVMADGDTWFYAGYTVDHMEIKHNMFSGRLSESTLFSPLSFKMRRLFKEIKKENPNYPARLRRILSLKQHISGEFKVKG